MPLLLERSGWHCTGLTDESEEEEEVRVSLLLCLGCSATAARMLMTCTWKYMDLERTGKSVTGRFADCTEVCVTGLAQTGTGTRKCHFKGRILELFQAQ